jgi:hypothetical protein
MIFFFHCSRVFIIYIKMEIVQTSSIDTERPGHALLSECIAISALLHRMGCSEYKRGHPRVVDCVELMNMMWEETQDVFVLCAGVLYFAHESGLLVGENVLDKIPRETIDVLRECTLPAGTETARACLVLSFVYRFLLKNHCREAQHEELHRKLANIMAIRTFFTHNRRIARIENHSHNPTKPIVDYRSFDHRLRAECAGERIEGIIDPRYPCEIACFENCTSHLYYKWHESEFEPMFLRERVVMLTAAQIEKFRKKPLLCVECKEYLHLMIPSDYHVSANDRSHPLLR